MLVRLSSSAKVMEELLRLQNLWSGPTNILPYRVLCVLPPSNENELARVVLFSPQCDEVEGPTKFKRLYTFYRCGFVTHDDPEGGYLIELFDDWKTGLESMVGYTKSRIRELRKIFAKFA